MRADEQVQDSKPLFERVSISKPYKDTLEHSVKDILNRPYLIESATWDSTMDNSHTVVDFQPQFKLRQKPNVAEKLSGFKYIRFGLKLRVMCNFTPVQTGKLLVAAIPCPSGGGFFHYREGDAFSMYQLTTCRHVEIDAGSQEEIEIELPFYNDKSAITFNDDPAQWHVIIKVLNKLGGSSNGEFVDVNVYASFTDIDLALPVGQSATEGEKKVEKGIISSTMDTVSQVAGALTSVPLLSDIAGPVSWVAGAASGIASFFGFSKPYNEGITQRMIVTPGASMANVDGIDTSFKLSALTNNGVEQTDVDDEMGIQQLAKRQGMIGQGTWAFSNEQFDPLFSCKVKPRQQVHFTASPKDPESETQSQEVVMQPPVSFLSTMFTYWRGDMSFRFSFAKNKFYSGKVMVTFRPSAIVESDDHEDNVYRRILSVNDLNDLVVTIPYVYDKYWANVNEDIGLLELSVFNRLQATSIVPQKIEFNVWAFSNNIHFAFPATKLPISFFQPDQDANMTPLPTSVLASKREPLGIAQSIQSTNVDQTADSDYLFKTVNVGMPERYTTGEVITNLRPLTRRFNFWKSAPSIRVNSTEFNKSWGLSLVDLASDPHQTETILDYLGGMFMFKRGSLRFKGYSGKTTGLGYVQQSHNESIGIKDALPDPALKSGATVMTLNSVNGVIETEVPFYADRERWYTAFARNALSVPAFKMGFLNEELAYDESLKLWFAAAGDDFTFSFYQGIPGTVVGAYSDELVKRSFV